MFENCRSLIACNNLRRHHQGLALPHHQFCWKSPFHRPTHTGSDHGRVRGLFLAYNTKPSPAKDQLFGTAVTKCPRVKQIQPSGVNSREWRERVLNARHYPKSLVLDTTATGAEARYPAGLANEQARGATAPLSFYWEATRRQDRVFRRRPAAHAAPMIYASTMPKTPL